MKNITEKQAEYIKKFVLATEKLPGDLAEVGVSIGDSAEVICQNKGERALHLFDTFTGHPKGWIGRYDYGQTPGRHAADLATVKQRLSKYPNTRYYPGIFPETSPPVKNKLFSFVHLDTDLYESTKWGLEFFFPRLVQDGIIVVHDSTYILGVGVAIVDYFAERHKQQTQDWQAVTELELNQTFIKKCLTQ